jgi:hypothetical protein
MRYTKELFEVAPKFFRSMLKTLLTLSFEDIPPYEEMINLLSKEIKKLMLL